MRVAIIGLGKLGLCCALAMESKGHGVVGYDINPAISEILANKKLPYTEADGDELLQKSKIRFLPIAECVEFADIIFVAVQTPHNPEYEGINPMPEERKDFDYSYLKNAIKAISELTDKQVVIISTVLPGTIRREILPIYNNIIYNPFFIAMGTTVKDFLNPEFVLIGSDEPTDKLQEFYSTIHQRPQFRCTVEEAEMIKVVYNTYISTKICFANTVMELSHSVGNINCDRVTEALSLAKERIISPRYMKGGMGDAGGCHPRDNIAMSWLAEKHGISFDWFENIIRCRERQTEWLADYLYIVQAQRQLDVVILGKAFKKNINSPIGSCGVLLKYYHPDCVHYDPYIDTYKLELEKAIYFIATEHDCFKDYDFPEGSVVIDPFRYIERKSFELIQIGKSCLAYPNQQYLE